MDKKILVVEDEKSLARLLKFCIRGRVDDVRVCHDGEEAIRLIGKNKFDLIFLDIMMPKRNGFDVATYIRKINKEVPVIGITAMTDVNLEYDAVTSGFTTLVKKPFGTDEINNILNVYLKEV